MQHSEDFAGGNCKADAGAKTGVNAQCIVVRSKGYPGNLIAGWTDVRPMRCEVKACPALDGGIPGKVNEGFGAD